MLRRAKEYTCNISSGNKEIFNLCEVIFFSFFPKKISMQERICLIQGIRSMQKYLKCNVINYYLRIIFRLPENYCLVDNGIDNLNDILEGTRHPKRKKKQGEERLWPANEEKMKT